MALHTILVVALNGNGDAGAGLGGGEGVGVDPALEHAPETTLAHHAPLPEIARRLLQFVKAEPPQI